jgi:signal recognition particle receptor subunit alpha
MRYFPVGSVHPRNPVLTVRRSGAVEQLRVHTRNLGMLALNNPDIKHGSVELYEKGYGKDAAGIAKEAITYG